MQVSRRCSIVLPTRGFGPGHVVRHLRSDHAENSGARHWQCGVSRHGGVCQFAPPHTLVEAFKATLEEVIHSDLLLHVVDGVIRYA